MTTSLEKTRDYDITFRLLKDRKIVDSRGITLKGLDTLVPEEKQLKMTLRDVDFEITAVKNNTVTIKARFYIDALENYSETTFHIKAIQFESNVLADNKWLDMDVVKGKTLLVESNLTAPKDYNYLVKLEAWREDSLLKTWQKGLNLAPIKRVSENVTEEEVRFEAKEFVKTPAVTPMPVPTPTPRIIGDVTQEEAMPGFDVLVALITMGGVLLWRKR